MNDPDRFFKFSTPGAQEWWYFDAISDDGRDVLVVVWYVGLPFDPSYGVAALRHLKDPARHPQPDALDHCAIGFSLHRDGKPLAYALNAFEAPSFAHEDEPFAIEIDGNRLERDAEGYSLHVATPDVDGKTRIESRFRFRPAAETSPLERDLGAPGSRHVWMLAAADCAVEGQIRIGTRDLTFRGRGYHDHNAGEQEISRAIRRWEWGRVHHGPLTDVYYFSQPHDGPRQALHLTCRDGRPESIRTPTEVRGTRPTRNIFGVRFDRDITIRDDSGTLRCHHETCLDDGPFYRRSLTRFAFGSNEIDSAGISELLDTRNLNRVWFNWMIPFRLKRPAANVATGDRFPK